MPYQNVKIPAGEKIAIVMANSRCRNGRSFPSSKETAPERTSGELRSESSMPRWPRRMAVNGKSAGWKFMPAKRRSRSSATGCPTRRSKPSASSWSASRACSTTPIGGGIRSLNVALRQLLDLYVCLRPVRWFKGVPSPVKNPGKVDMVIFRENTEDIYAGIEFEMGSEQVKKFLALFQEAFLKEVLDLQNSFSQDQRHRHQAGLAGGNRTPGSLGPAIRRCQQAQESDTGPQGKHHEVHRGGLP